MSDSQWAERIRSFCASWFNAPLGPEDGCSAAEIAEVESEVGAAFPSIVREWFSLVGRRLREGQDYPVRLEEISAVSKRLMARVDAHNLAEKPTLPLWTENQGVWSIAAPLRDGDDPEVVVSPPEFAKSTAKTSEALFGMLVSDTLVGAWAGCGQGPLGALNDEVVGGYVEWRQELEAAFLALPQLPWFPNPFFHDPYRGDAFMVARNNGAGWEWAARGAEAVEKMKRVFELDSPGGNQVLTFSLSNLALGERDELPVELDQLHAAIGDAGRVRSTSSSTAGEWFNFELSTVRPDDCVRRILKLLPLAVHNRLTVASRPEGVSLYRVLYPGSRASERWFPR